MYQIIIGKHIYKYIYNMNAMGGDDITPNHHFQIFKILMYQIITKKIITF